MPNDIETCRRCGKTGYKIDEFLEYWTGLCKNCYGAAKTKTNLGSPNGKNQPTTINEEKEKECNG